MKTSTHNTAPHKRGGGGNNFSLNPQKSSLRGSVTTEAIHKNKAESMDYHAVQAPLAMTEKIAATTHTAPSKSASLSLACAIALSSAVLIPNQAKANGMNFNNKGTGSFFDGNANCQGKCVYDSVNVVVGSGYRVNLTFGIAGASVDTLNMQAQTSQGWRNVRLNTSTTITTANVTGPFNLEFKTSGNDNKSTIDTLNNQVQMLNLKVGPDENNPPHNATLTINTLNQLTNGDSQNFKNVSVDTFNLHSGRSYQRGGAVTNLNIQGGSFYQGYQDNMNLGEHDGTIETITLQDGIFQQGKGSVTTLTQSGGQATQQNGTITTLNLKGGVFNHNGGTLTTINLQDGNWCI